MVYEQSVVVYVKGVILAGGTGTRLLPLTKVTNKHLLPVYNEPMIYKVISTLLSSGIDDITIVLGGESVGDFVKLLGDGSDLGVKLTYVYQQQAGGIAEALYVAKRILKGHKLAVMLGDNIFEDSFRDEMFRFRFYPDYECFLFLKRVEDVKRYGVAVLNEECIIQSIEEKPKNPKSNYAVTGLYFYDEKIFDVIEKIIDEVGYSSRGELEITDVNNYYIRQGKTKAIFVKGFWSDAGTMVTLLKSSVFVMNKKNI
jgi:glucose-1-phosphate thymidylyltransferase